MLNAKEKSEKPKSSLTESPKENINMPRQRVMGGYSFKNVSSITDSLKDEKKDVVKIEREKETASAAQGLEKLKSSHSPAEEPSKLSKLPKINDGNQENEDDYKKIEIPRRKRFESAGQTEEKEFGTSEKTKEETASVSSAGEKIYQPGDESEKNTLKSKSSSFSSGSGGAGKGQPKNNIIGRNPSVISNKIIAPPIKNIEKNIETIEKKSGIKESDLSSIAAKGIDSYKLNISEDLKAQPGAKEIPLYEKPDVLNNDLKWTSNPTERLREELKRERSEPTARNFVKEQEKTSVFGDKSAKERHSLSGASKKQSDNYFFGDKSEVSRIDLRQKLRKDVNIWRAQKQAGLNLSPIERVKLEKEVFSQALGRNISKTDLKWGVKKLNQKMLNAKDISEKGKLRKEIKFLKKIGGI
ncbi:hypothetical protein J4229_02040 [Candidatus Pacearchaeota archaeon]|nr:hypothetical protein [Candidatus Pacearchaeota archaeon]